MLIETDKTQPGIAVPRLILILCCFAAVSADGLAQSSLNQQISGQVVDLTGAALANVTVTVVNQGTNLARTAKSNEGGNYIVTDLPTGMYRVTAEFPGFKTEVISDNELTTNLSLEVNLKMQVGSQAESITVRADVAQVETSNGDLGYSVTGEQISEIQLNGRNFPELLSLVPGVSTTYQSSFSLFGGYGVTNNAQSVNGGRGDTITWNLSGADNKDNGGGGNNFVNINPDALGEFRIMTSNFSAESGTSSGAVVNLSLRSGTQKFHGKMYEYFRNDALDARPFNAIVKPELRWNNFGWNFGGPVILPLGLNKNREKLFFFVAQDFKRLRTGSTNTWTVPSQQNLQGDFSNLASNRWPKDPSTGVVYAGGIIPASDMNPNGVKLLNIYPKPNFTGSGGNFVFNETQPLNTNEYVIKTDYNINEKNQISVHYVHDYYDSLQNVTNMIQYWREVPGLNSSVQWNHVFSPTVINVAQFTYTGNVIVEKKHRVPNPVFVKDFTRAGLGLTEPTIYNASPDMPQVAVSGYTTLSATPLNFDNFNRIFDWKDTLTKIVNNHTLKMGVLIMRSRKNQDSDPAINGQLNFNTTRSPSSGNAVADGLLGDFYQYTEASTIRQGWYRFWQIEPFFQDDWKISRRLTINLGLRMSYIQPQYSALNNTVQFLPQYFDRAQVATIDPKTGSIISAPNPYNGLVIPGPGFPDSAKGRVAQYGDPAVQALFHNLPLGGAYTRWGNYAPRIGFAYDLTGRQNTVLRGGYGVAYERIQGNFIFGGVNNPPFIQQVTVLNGNIDNPAGAVVSPNPVQNINNSHYLDMKDPRTMTWSLGIQRKIGKDMTLDVTYCGSTAANLSYQDDINQLPAGTLTAHPGVNANALRPYPGFGDIYEFNTGANFVYNSLQSQFRKQFTGAGIFNVAFTWSKGRTDANAFNSQPMDSYNLRGDWGRSNYNRGRILVISYVYPLPLWRRARDAWYKKAFGGWQLSGVSQIQTGLPINITLAPDRAGTGVTGGQRPELVGDPLSGPGVGGRQYLNPAAFALPAAGTFGNLGAYSIVGPSWNTWNASVTKSFPVRERFQWYVRIEVFNFPNHLSYFGVNGGSVNTTAPPNFGQISSATDPRILQFSLRISF